MLQTRTTRPGDAFRFTPASEIPVRAAAHVARDVGALLAAHAQQRRPIMDEAQPNVQQAPVLQPGAWPAMDGAGLELGGDSDLQVLVVEDDDADAYLIRSALKRNPRVTQMVLAHDGIEALELLDSGLVAPDIAIVDLHMPRKNGFSLLVELRCRPRADFPAIVLSSSSASADNARSRLRGADLFLTKPDSIDELHRLLSGAMANI
jgi:CheY-like chemotaxis protein